MAIPEVLAWTREHVDATLANAVTRADPLAILFGLQQTPKGMLEDRNLQEAADYIQKLVAPLQALTRLSESTGGYQLVTPVLLEHAGTAKGRSRLEKAPDKDVGKVSRAVFSLGTLSQSVIIDRQDIATNQGKERILSFVAGKMLQQWADLYNTFANKAWTGTGSGTDWAGTKYIITDSNGTVGGISQSTYSAWRPERYTPAISSFSTNDAGPKQMADLIEKTDQEPDYAIIVTTRAIAGYWAQYNVTKANVYGLVHANMPPKAKAMWASLGATHVAFMGLPVLKSAYVPDQHMYGIDLRHILFKHTPAAKLEGLPANEQPYMVGPVEVGPWVRHPDRPAWQLIFEVQGAIVVDKMNCHWVITQIQDA
ncbi:MAG: phage major capsid protein [Planctomycetota bacterium]|nr:MAG: phage major capsid protein [Planctomycetota bacterium]